MEYSEAIELAELIRGEYPQLRPEVIPLTSDQPPRSMWGEEEPKDMPPTKPFPLTKDQLRAWLDDAEQHGVGAGVAALTTECPLARAYRHVHPDSNVHVGRYFANTTDHEYELTDWQKKFVVEVDGLSAPDAYWELAVSPQEARAILEQVGSDE